MIEAWIRNNMPKGRGLCCEELAGYHEITFEESIVLGGNLGFRRVFKWEPPGDLPVTQIQEYYVENGRSYLATATANSSEIGRYEAEMQDVLVNTTLIRGDHRK